MNARESLKENRNRNSLKGAVPEPQLHPIKMTEESQVLDSQIVVGLSSQPQLPQGGSKIKVSSETLQKARIF